MTPAPAGRLALRPYALGVRVSRPLRRYAVPVVFIAGLCAVSTVYTYALRPAAQRSLVAATATNLANLPSDPLGTLVASAFVTESGPWVWPVFAALGLFPLVHRFGNLRGLLLVGAAHVIGTLVSEGVLAWRISTGAAPPALRLLDDVGPSYVITAALLATVLYGVARPWRIGAAAGLAVLAPSMVDGLEDLDVAAVGHVVALAVGAVIGLVLVRSAPVTDPRPPRGGR
jgi:rhomboid family protein